jgi:RNA polymerase sigma factor (sigma-70 family)
MNFPTTHWSLLAKASINGDEEGSRALEELCKRYSEPVRRFIRSRGVSEVEAEDLAQEFMMHLIQKSTFKRADRFRGRFRSFLLGALMRFLREKAQARAALKRGSGFQHVSFDAEQEMVEGQMVSGGEDATLLFDREWALAALEGAFNRVRAEYSSPDRQRTFEVLKLFLPGASEPPSYEEGAGKLGLSVAALKSEIHRLRQRFRALLREEVGQTVSAPHEIGAEMAHLQKVLMDRSSDFGVSLET